METTDSSSLQDHKCNSAAESCEKNSQIFELKAFLEDNYNDRLILLSKSNYHVVKRPVLIFLHHFKIKGAALKQWTDKLYEVSAQFPKTIQFAIMDFENALLFHLSWSQLNDFGFDVCIPPYVFAIDTDERQHDFDEEFTSFGLQRFCEYLEQNKHYHSDPMPAQQNSDFNVDIIVADNFRQLVEQNDKDVFVTLHSKYSFKYDFHLWGVPSELSADNDDLVFYAINAHTNYIPLEYRVSELPTSFFIPRNNKNKRLKYINKYYDGGEIIRFIAKNASAELKSVDRKGYFKVNKTTISTYFEPEEIKHTVVGRFDTVVKNALARNQTDDDGFIEFLNSMLKKINDEDRKDIEMELIALAMNRINKV